MKKDWAYNITKWFKIARNGYAVITSKGQINARNQDIAYNEVCKLVVGNPFEIARAAAKFKKEYQR
ncbi:MAG: hypothetical protein II843_04075 [Alphaproteobacteria bacterium]|nr:hypothetical protein [Alphaproteobacteria bacterium]